MTSPILQVADLIVERINARTVVVASQGAERTYLPQLNVEEMGTDIFVSVMPQNEDIDILSRSKKFREIAIDVGITKKLLDDSSDDEVLDLRDEFIDLFYEYDFTSPKAEFKGIGTPVLFDQEQMVEKRVMITVVRLMYRVTET